MIQDALVAEILIIIICKSLSTCIIHVTFLFHRRRCKVNELRLVNSEAMHHHGHHIVFHLHHQYNIIIESAWLQFQWIGTRR